MDITVLRVKGDNRKERCCDCNPRGPEEKRPRTDEDEQNVKTLLKDCKKQWKRTRDTCGGDGGALTCEIPRPACIECEKRHRHRSFPVIRFLVGGGDCEEADECFQILMLKCISTSRARTARPKFLRIKNDFYKR